MDYNKLSATFAFVLFFALSAFQARAEEKLYWISNTDFGVYRSNTDGGNQEKILNGAADTFVPSQLLIDDANSLIYIADSISDNLFVGNLNATPLSVTSSVTGFQTQNFDQDHILGAFFFVDSDFIMNQFTTANGVQTIQSSVFGLAVSPQQKRLYYTSGSTISQIDYSGANGVFTSPTSFDFDSGSSALKYLNATDKLIWYSSGLQAIRSKAFNASLTDVPATVVSLGGGSNFPTSIDANRSESKIFWTDSVTPGIFSYDVASGATQQIVNSSTSPKSVALSCGFFSPNSDGDSTPDCDDACPLDALKLSPGICGCGLSDADSDADQIVDCLDGCPLDSLKTAPGTCGCGISDSLLTETGSCEGVKVITPETVITEPPRITIEDRTIRIVLQKFTLPGAETSAKSRNNGPVLTARERRMNFRYTVIVRNKSKMKRDVKNLSSKRNELTVRNLKPGNYVVRYKAQILRNGNVTAVTKPSPKATFTILP